MKEYVGMALNEAPYLAIKSGTKTVELRLFDEKRSALAVGDIIIFSRRECEDERFAMQIAALHRAKSFRELLAPDILAKSGFADHTAEAASEAMRCYYSEEEEKKYGVLGIELAPVIDIHSKGDYPCNMLSNFYSYAFVIDGISCAGMEGFLQSLKFFSRKKQKEVCRLSGKSAKEAGGEKRLWKFIKRVHWQGRLYRRESEDFSALILRAYTEMYYQCKDFREALNATRGLPIIHSIGARDKRKTILTEEEFISVLEEIKKQGLRV